MLDVKKREIGKKFLELLNSKPVIGALFVNLTSRKVNIRITEI